MHQLLVYPVTNNNVTTPSYQQNAAAKPLDKPTMEWFVAHYTGNPRPTASTFPRHARSRAGLPPATVVTTEIDPLRDDGKGYADALTKAGVAVAYKNSGGVTHAFLGMGAVVGTASFAAPFATDGLKTGFGK